MEKENLSREYSIVGKRVGSNIKGTFIHTCHNCNERTLVTNVNKWRNTGAGLICDVCAGTKPGCIVANDNYEILKVKSNYEVELPERLKQ